MRGDFVLETRFPDASGVQGRRYSGVQENTPPCNGIPTIFYVKSGILLRVPLDPHHGGRFLEKFRDERRKLPVVTLDTVRDLPRDLEGLLDVLPERHLQYLLGAEEVDRPREGTADLDDVDAILYEGPCKETPLVGLQVFPHELRGIDPVPDRGAGMALHRGEFVDEEFEEEHGPVLVHLAVGPVDEKTVPVKHGAKGIETLSELRDHDVLDVGRGGESDGIEEGPPR